MNDEAENAATLELFEGLFESPTLYLRNFDIGRDRVRFALMTEAAYADSAFLDTRLERVSAREFGLDFSPLLEVHRRRAPPRRAMHYLFHIGHCGSTLLSRMLGALGGVLSLREPPPLLELAQCKRRATGYEIGETRWRQACELTLALLSRTFRAADVAVVKPNSHANNLIRELLAWHPGCRGVLLHVDLETYLATMLRPHMRPETERAVDESRLEDFRRRMNAEEPPLQALNEAQQIALVWLMQMREFADALENEAHRDRIHVIEFGDLLDDSRGRLAELADFLRLDSGSPALDRALGPATTGRYSKLTHEPYDAEARERILEESRRAHASEISTGIEWVEQMCARYRNFTQFAGAASFRFG